MLVYFSKKIRQFPAIQHICDQPVLTVWQALKSKHHLSAVIGWYSEYRSILSRRYARHTGVDYLSVEEGFVAYPPSQQMSFLGRRRCSPYSIILNRQGNHLNARQPSELECLLNNIVLTDQQLTRAQQVMSSLIKHRISQYNHQPIRQPAFVNELRGKPVVLVVDQSRFDRSITGSMASGHDFDSMLESAISENPGAAIVVKLHHSRLARWMGHFGGAVNRYPAVHICAEAINAIQLLSHVHKVYTVSDRLGLEALLLGKEVHCFGMPFYAGWGLTQDKKNCSRRKRRLTVNELFHGVYLQYPTYIHPVTREVCELEDIIQHIALQHHYHRKNQGKWLCVDMSLRQRMLNAYLQGHSGLTFRKRLPKPEVVKRFDHVITWGRRSISAAQQQRYGIVAVEDGFVRSINAGRYRIFSNSFSMNFDPIGIYFDGQVPSAIENVLNTHVFTEQEKSIGQMVMDYCVKNHITKYNLTEHHMRDLSSVRAQKILVPGQVPDDASISHGTAEVSSNLSLLQAVRAKHPKAYLIFKPHPDVSRRQRSDPVSTEIYQSHCDLFATDSNIIDCINAVDEVHTMTSLSGFEALMRGKRVVVYGKPFYAGWGVTHDEVLISRRRRKLSLIELVTGALVLYPRYFDYQSQSFTDAKHMMLKIQRIRELSLGET